MDPWKRERVTSYAEDDGEALVAAPHTEAELAYVLAPRLVGPAETLGYGGFQVAAYWSGTRHCPANGPKDPAGSHIGLPGLRPALSKGSQTAGSR